MYAAGGTGQWDIYGNGANLRFSDNAGAGSVVFDRNVDANGGLDVLGSTTFDAGNVTNALQIQAAGSYNLYSYHDSAGVGWATGAGGSFGELLYLDANGNTARLYTGGSERFRANSSGVSVTGDVTVTNDVIIPGSGEFYGYDGSKLVLGHGRDLRIYHDGGNSYIDEFGTGNLFIRSNSEIKHNANKKLETTSTGATVTGTLTATSFSGDGSNLTGVSGAEIYGFNTDTNGNLIVTTTNGGADNISGTTFDAFEDVVFAATGFSFSVNANGKLIATI